MIEKENFTKWRLKIFLFGIPVFFLSIGVLRFIFRVIKKYVIVLVLLLVASSNVFASVPIVETLSATNITDSSVTLHGTVKPRNLVTQYSFFYYDSLGWHSTSTQFLPADNQIHSVSVGVSGLVRNYQYSFYLHASNSSGSSTGSALYFTTLSWCDSSVGITITPDILYQDADVKIELFTCVNTYREGYAPPEYNSCWVFTPRSGINTLRFTGTPGYYMVYPFDSTLTGTECVNFSLTNYQSYHDSCTPAVVSYDSFDLLNFGNLNSFFVCEFDEFSSHYCKGGKIKYKFKVPVGTPCSRVPGGVKSKGVNVNYKQGGLIRAGRIGFGVGGFERVIQ